ncbi:copper homeostasis protein CutC [Clostridium sp. JN-9]|uniref:copper homeostasis protein CutC n=1 Tax=Clostridium sp. JN-9 TaxID=2507159 RepID=UPI000FFDF7D4|nr:copper homeostasis protein CutC [Clostridium sp. JN-9]QAT39806.1 copper homeostasis protein CutC [Clostridium sp. JN-9]
MNKTAEVCCGSYYDCLQAFKGKAERVELNSALYLGGLTPSIAELILTKKNTNLKVICMARPRAAGFCYEKEDYETLLLDVKLLMDNGADGIAFGCLDDKGNINALQTEKVVELIKSYGEEKEAVFHRAFDCVSDAFEAAKVLIKLGVDRILTSGLEARAVDGKEVLKALQKSYGHEIQILAGSGVNAGNAKELMEYTGITQIHSSCKTWLEDKTTTKNHVTYAYGKDEFSYDVVDSEQVEQLVKVVNKEL